MSDSSRGTGSSQQLPVVDARFVTNFLIKHADNPLTPLQAVKLVYFCHGWMLGLFQQPLLRQSVEAWPYGPVIPKVYSSLKRYGADLISEQIRINPAPRERPSGLNDLQEKLIEEVYRKYGHLSGVQLSTLTHRKGTPWHSIWYPSGKEAWDRAGINLVIPNELIERYFALRRQTGHGE